MNEHHVVTDVSFDGDILKLTVDGHKKEFPVSGLTKRLQIASQIQRSEFEVTPSGYGIHWPMIDEDLSIDGLLGIKHAPQGRIKTA